MHRSLAPFAPLALLFAVACDAQPSADEYRNVLPDERLLISMPEADGLRAAGDPSQFRSDTKEIATQVNGLIGDVLGGIDEITSYDPTWSDTEDDTALWGPWTDGGLDILLAVSRHDDDHYEWALMIRAEGGSDDDWAPYVAGEVDPGATETTGSGRFAIDFGVLTDLSDSPDEVAYGLFVSEYDVADDTVDASAAYEDYHEGDGAEPVNALYRYSQDPVGGLMDVAYEHDVAEGGELETVILRSRWNQGGEGRGDAYITGGDFGELVYTATECWNPSGITVFTEDNAELQTSGDEAQCAFDEPAWPEDGV
jgi:hypothetical protein